MALMQEIKNVVNELSAAPAFFFGTENEFNNAADDIDFTNGLVFMYSLQKVTNQATNNNSINNSYDLFLAFLFKTDTDTTSEQCEVFDIQAINMINEFFVKLQRYTGGNGGRVFKVNVKDKANSTQCKFNYADVNLYGRSFSMTLSTFYNDKICF